MIIGLVLVVALTSIPSWAAGSGCSSSVRSRCGDPRFPPSQNAPDNGRTDSRLAFERLDNTERTQSVRSTGFTSITGVPSTASRSLTRTLFSSTARTVTVRRPRGLGRSCDLVSNSLRHGLARVIPRMHPQHGTVGEMQPRDQMYPLPDCQLPQRRLVLFLEDEPGVGTSWLTLFGRHGGIGETRLDVPDRAQLITHDRPDCRRCQSPSLPDERRVLRPSGSAQ